jgi:hypothetical protein
MQACGRPTTENTEKTALNCACHSYCRCACWYAQFYHGVVVIPYGCCVGPCVLRIPNLFPNLFKCVNHASKCRVVYLHAAGGKCDHAPRVVQSSAERAAQTLFGVLTNNGMIKEVVFCEARCCKNHCYNATAASFSVVFEKSTKRGKSPTAAT